MTEQEEKEQSECRNDDWSVVAARRYACWQSACERARKAEEAFYTLRGAIRQASDMAADVIHVLEPVLEMSIGDE